MSVFSLSLPKRDHHKGVAGEPRGNCPLGWGVQRGREGGREGGVEPTHLSQMVGEFYIEQQSLF